MPVCITAQHGIGRGTVWTRRVKHAAVGVELQKHGAPTCVDAEVGACVSSALKGTENLGTVV